MHKQLFKIIMVGIISLSLSMIRRKFCWPPERDIKVKSRCAFSAELSLNLVQPNALFTQRNFAQKGCVVKRDQL